jgi:hypothetical protein
MDRTLDRIMGKGVYTLKPTIPVAEFDAVPSRAVGMYSGKWARGRRPGRQDTWLRGGRGLSVAVEERVELHELQLDGGEGSLQFWLPIGEGFVDDGRCSL